MEGEKITSLNNLPETAEVKQPFDPAAVLKSCWIDPDRDVEKPPVAMEVITNEKHSPAFTLGNFSLIIGKAKSKKTFLLTALAAAVASNDITLECIRGTLLHDKRAVLYFDTEQSEYHLNRTIKRVLKQSSDLSNFRAFGLRRFKPAERLKLVEFAIYNTSGVGFVFIDGIRDLLNSINDETEATLLTSDFLRWTAELNIHLVTVLHQNKGDLNARGHIGTECLNKAETVISVTVDASDKDTSIVSCEMSRDLGFDDFAFTINEEGLPEICEMPEKSTNKKPNIYPDKLKDALHYEVLVDIYKNTQEPKYNELMDAIISNFGKQNIRFGQSKCRLFIAYYIDKGWIEKMQSGKNVFYKYKRAVF